MVSDTGHANNIVMSTLYALLCNIKQLAFGDWKDDAKDAEKDRIFAAAVAAVKRKLISYNEDRARIRFWFDQKAAEVRLADELHPFLRPDDAIEGAKTKVDQRWNTVKASILASPQMGAARSGILKLLKGAEIHGESVAEQADRHAHDVYTILTASVHDLPWRQPRKAGAAEEGEQIIKDIFVTLTEQLENADKSEKNLAEVQNLDDDD